MLRKKPAGNERQTEDMIGNLLRVGVVTAASLVFVGGIIYFVQQGLVMPDYKVFRAGPEELRTIPGIMKDAFHLRGKGVIQLGLLVLIATPVARVIFSLFAFLRRRDAMYTVITLIVLVTLSISLFNAK
jgi:uncharacterized membrane protein